VVIRRVAILADQHPFMAQVVFLARVRTAHPASLYDNN